MSLIVRMFNCMCIVEENGFNSHQFVLDVLNNKLNKDNMIYVDKFTFTEDGYFIYKDRIYKIYTNVVKNNYNYIACIDTCLR